MKLPLSSSDKWLVNFERYYALTRASFKPSRTDLRIYPVERETSKFDAIDGNEVILGQEAIIDTGSHLTVLPGKFRSKFTAMHVSHQNPKNNENIFLVAVRIQEESQNPLYVTSFAYFSDQRNKILLGMDFLRSFIFLLNITDVFFQLDLYSSPVTPIGGKYRTFL